MFKIYAGKLQYYYTFYMNVYYTFYNKFFGPTLY